MHTQTHTQGGANTHTHTHTQGGANTHTQFTLKHTHKVALGLRAGQSHEQEKIDLQSRNWHKFSKVLHILTLLTTSAMALTHLRIFFSCQAPHDADASG
jgi:hypothetical protein